MQALHDVDRARDALAAIPADLSHDDWVTVGMASKAAGLEEDDFLGWSANSPDFNEREARAKWRSFKDRSGGIGPGTLYRMAAQNGWRIAPKPRQRPADRPERPQARFSAPGKGLGASEVWNRCTPADASHPYIQRKNGLAEGLRVLPADDPLHQMGEPMAGALVVPVYRLDGSISSLQLITAGDTATRLKAKGKPDKFNLRDCPMEGWFPVGDLTSGGTVYLCEGIGQAWAVFKATGKTAVVTFGCGRMRTVAEQLRQADPTARLVLVPDAGMEDKAEAIAREVRGSVVPMPAGSPRNFDVNDLAQRDGMEVLEMLLSNPKTPAQRYQLLGQAELEALPPLSWRIRGVLPQAGIAGLYGPSGCGKSFLGFHMAASIADGTPWFGYRTTAAPVVYVALEGEAGMQQRAAAWVARHGRPLPARLHLVLDSFKLTEEQDVADLAAVIPPGAVVFIDTLNRAAPTSDENSSKDMGAILEATKQLQKLTGGLVVLVHHTGKDATRGLRGHSSLHAALDGAIEVSRDGDRRQWCITKAKDGKDGLVRAFRLQEEILGTDADGEHVSSCVVVPDSGTEDVRRVRVPGGKNQRIALNALNVLFKDGALAKASAPPGVRCIELEAAIAAVSASLPCESHRRTERAQAAVTGLVSAGFLLCEEGWLWKP